MPPYKPRYYIRTMIAGRWHYLYKIKYYPTHPVWLDELLLKRRQPKLYKSLVIARNTLDTYTSTLTPSQVAVWSDPDANA